MNEIDFWTVASLISFQIAWYPMQKFLAGFSLVFPPYFPPVFFLFRGENSSFREEMGVGRWVQVNNLPALGRSAVAHIGSIKYTNK